MKRNRRRHADFGSLKPVLLQVRACISIHRKSVNTDIRTSETRKHKEANFGYRLVVHVFSLGEDLNHVRIFSGLGP